MKTRAAAVALVLLSLVTPAAQRRVDSVFIEDLTSAEVASRIAAGTTTVIVGTAGTEQKGPHMVGGEHKFVMAFAADRIARALDRTLVAPVIAYVPEGSWERPTGHMSKPGTITLPEDRFVELLVHAGRSLKAGGFTTILFLGESGGNRTGMRTAAARLTELFNASGGGARAFWVDDYYTKSHADQNAFISATVGIPENQIGNHANILDTSELLFVNPKHIRVKKLAPGGGYENSGVSGDPTKSTPAIGKALLQIKIDNAVAQARALMSGTAQPPAAAAASAGPGRAAASVGGGRAGVATPPRPTFETAPAGTPSQAPDTVFIDELTWEETRDALKAGTRTVIVPAGGTVNSGGLVLGTHNVRVTRAADAMARRLKKTLVAPTIQYVPDGDPDRAAPGAISLPSPAYDGLLDAAARSLKAHGFTEILFIGETAGSQPAMKTVADTLSAEWKDSGINVVALTQYYEAGRDRPATSVNVKVNAAIAQLRARPRR